MFPYISAVVPQIAYAHSVREFIRELLNRFIPGKWIDRVISDRDTAFDAKLDAAFSSLDEKTATEKDYCARVVSVLCEEVSGICEVLRLVCINRGHDEYAATYLSTEKFIRLLLRQDTAKLKRLNAAMSDASKPLCVLLRDIGAVLEDKSSDDGAAFCAAEMKKANAELKAIAADVKKTIKTGFGEVKRGIAEVGEKVDAVDERVSKSRRGKRRGKYDEETIAFCAAILSAAESNATIKNGLNTRITHDAVFSYNRRELVQRGVSDVAEFTRIIRAHKAREQRRREKSAAQKRPKNGIMRGMRKNAKHALIFAAAIAGGMAAPLRSAALPNTFEGGVRLRGKAA
jgi:hypothetical protein